MTFCIGIPVVPQIVYGDSLVPHSLHLDFSLASYFMDISVTARFELVSQLYRMFYASLCFIAHVIQGHDLYTRYLIEFSELLILSGFGYRNFLGSVLWLVFFQSIPYIS